MDELEAILETGGAAAVEIAASALAERGGTVVKCANCANPMIGPYCAVCGQPLNTHRRTLGRLLHEVVKGSASLDSRILRTAGALLFRPGELTLAFVEGRTQRYLPAVRLYFFVSLLFFLALAISHIAIVQFALTSKPLSVAELTHELADADSPAEKSEITAEYNDGKTHYTIDSKLVFFRRVGEVKSEMSPDAHDRLATKTNKAIAKARKTKNSWAVQATLATLLKLASDPAALNGALTAWIPRALFLLLPAFAILLAVFYCRQRKTFYFVDHLVFSLNLHSFGFIALLAAALLAQLAPSWVVGVVLLIAGPLYLLLAMRRCYRQNWLWTGVKFASVGFVYTVFFLLPAFGAVIALSVLYG